MKSIFILCLLFSFPSFNSFAQIQNDSTAVGMVAFIDSVFSDGIEQKLIPGGVTALVSQKRVLMLKGYGLSNVESNIPVSVDSTLFQLGSVGKLFTSIALLQNFEHGKIDINTSLNKYLNSLYINDSKFKLVTPYHLLTHTAGLNEKNIGYVERKNSDVKSLKSYFKENTPTLFQEPGKNINYSNLGYGLAGYLVESVSGMNFQKYVQQNILDPAYMDASTYHLPDDYRDRQKYARGYEVRNSFNEVKSYPRSLKPAGSIISTGREMSSFLKGILTKSLFLEKNSYKWIYDQQFTNHQSLPGVTFGLEEQFLNGQRFLAKGGNIPGFLSFVLIMPKEKLGLFAAVNTETDNFVRGLLGSFNNRFYPARNVEKYSTKPISVTDFEGTYRNMRAGHDTISDLFEMMIDHKKVEKLDNYTLGIVENNRFNKFLAVQDTVFLRKGGIDQKAVLARVNNEFNYLFGSENIAGLQVPASYKKVSSINAPETINEIYPFILMPIPLYLLTLILIPLVRYIRKDENTINKVSALPGFAHAVGLSFAVLFVIDISGFFIPLVKLIQNGEILFGLPDYFLNFRYLHWLMMINGIFIVGVAIYLWSEGKGRIFYRILYTSYLASVVFFLAILYKWHFLNVSI